jgi:drug/metabolite transporter (DMT)-like permease
MEVLLMALLLYLVPLLPVAGAAWFFGRRRVQWNYWDFAIVLLPLVAWIMVTMVNPAKSLSNLVIEVPGLGCVSSLAPLVRVAVGTRVDQRLLALGLLVALCLVAIGLGTYVPFMPE